VSSAPRPPVTKTNRQRSSASIAAEKIGFVSQKTSPSVSLPLLWRLPKADTWSATVLVDELDAGILQGTADT
jgi:hypothetical protein